MRRLLPVLAGLFLALAAIAPARAARSNVITSPRAEVTLVSATNAPTSGTITLGLLFQLKPDWHIYWSDPGDAGQAPTVSIVAPAGAKSGPFAFPPPHWLVAGGGVGDYIESGTVLLPFTVTLPRAGVSAIDAKADWLVCNPKLCVPEHGSFHLALAGGPSAEAALFRAAHAALPRPLPYRARIAPDGTLAVTGVGLGRGVVKRAHFYPYDSTVIVNAAPQRLGFVRNGFTLRLKPAHPPMTAAAGVIEITDPSGRMQALTLHAAPGAAPPPLAGTPWIVWLGAAVLAGLILNLMPCVFPVLAIKALAL
ncbi:MAG: cytochrome C biogenesis protein, partial [Acidiphilium sp. 37-67-22]